MSLLRRLIAPRAVVAAMCVALAWQLLCPPIVGIADNRDFWRVMNQVGLGYTVDMNSTVFKWIQTRFAIITPTHVAYLTSEVWIIRAAMALSRIFSKDGFFDLRWAGLCNGALLLTGAWLLLAVHRDRPTPVRLWLALATFVVFTDFHVAAWMNSFYSDTASLVFGLAAFALALALAERRTLPLYLAFVAAAVLFLIAKTQNLAYVPTLALIGWIGCPRPAGGGLARRLAPLAVPLFLLGLAVWAIESDAYAESKGTNVRIMLDDEILVYSTDPAADLRELHVPDRNYGRLTVADLALFHARHPQRWWKMCRRTARDAFSWIPYGSFERSTGEPAQSQAFNLWCTWKESHFPHQLIPILLVALAIVVFAALKAWRLDRSARGRRRAVVLVALVLGTLAELFISVSFEANGNAKHLFLFDVMTDLALIVTGVELLELASRRRPAAA